MNEQITMFDDGLIEEHKARLLRVLNEVGWMTRRQLAVNLGWDDRQIRKVAEACGTDVVRGPKGFATWGLASLDEISHAARIFREQATKMDGYAQALERRLHARVSKT